MVHFPGLARTRLCIQRAVIWFYQIGFPHSDIPGSKPVCGSPGLFAAYRVLHRLLAPRHPPYALSSLTIKLTQHVPTPSGSGAPGLRKDGSCVPYSSILGVLCSRFLPFSGLKRTHKRREQASSPFHKTLLSSKTCGLSRYANLEIRITRCLLPSVVKDRCSGQQFPIGTSPLPAERNVGLEPSLRKNSVKNKKPGASAGRIRPFPGSRFWRAPRTDVLEARFLSIRYS
jgi:hypothetical protein